jgi:hypothetical protein
MYVSQDSWKAGGSTGDLFQPPSSVDIVAIGGKGYFVIDDTLLAIVDLTDSETVGDVVLSAEATPEVQDAVIVVSDFTIWELPTPPSTSPVSADDEIVYRELIVDSESLQPLYGPADVELHFGTTTSNSDTSRTAGVIAKDLRVHLEITAWKPPGIGLIVGIRQQDEASLSEGPTSVFVGEDQWSVEGQAKYLCQALSSVDIVAVGNTGYLGIDGSLVATFDLSGWEGSGEVVLSLLMEIGTTEASLEISDFTVWELDS